MEIHVSCLCKFLLHHSVGSLHLKKTVHKTIVAKSFLTTCCQKKKMIYFKFNRKYLDLMGINLFDVKKQYFMKSLLKNVSVVLLFVLYWYFSGGFIYQHLDRLEITTTAIALFLGCSCHCSQILFFKFSERDVEQLMINYQQSIDRGDCYLVANKADEPSSACWYIAPSKAFLNSMFIFFSQHQKRYKNCMNQLKRNADN